MTWVDGLILLLVAIAAGLFFGAPLLAAVLIHQRRELFRWRHVSPGDAERFVARRHHDHLLPRTPNAPR